MGNACGKVARKSDLFKKVNAARLYRKSLFSRYRVKLNKKGSPRFCHTWGRHGATRTVEWQTKRMLGLLERQGVPETTTPSWFHDKQAEMYARESFLRAHKEEMDRIAAAIDAGDTSTSKWFSKSIELAQPIGVGLDSSTPQVEFHLDIEYARFAYQYENGTWYEATGFPDVASHKAG